MIRTNPLQESRQQRFDSFAAREVQRARRADPETSKAAAAESHGLVAEHELLILQAMRDGGDRDWIAHDLAVACALTPVQVSRRLGAMVVDGTIVEVRDSKDRHVTREAPTGRKARCYRRSP